MILSIYLPVLMVKNTRTLSQLKINLAYYN